MPSRASAQGRDLPVAEHLSSVATNVSSGRYQAWLKGRRAAKPLHGEERGWPGAALFDHLVRHAPTLFLAGRRSGNARQTETGSSYATF